MPVDRLRPHVSERGHAVRLLFGADAYVADWVAARIPWLGDYWDGGECKAIGVMTLAGEMAGGVVYHSYNPRFRSMEWSAAAARRDWLTPFVINAMFRYPFVQHECRRLTAIVPASRESAKPARILHRRLGFKREGTARKAFGSDDAAIYGMIDSEWRNSRFNLERKQVDA